MIELRIAAAATLLLGASVGAEDVYRCDVDGVETFSDRPCGPDAHRHDEQGGISFIEPDENLPALAEAAQSFIRERRERLARRHRRTATTPPAPVASSSAERDTIFVPWPVRPHRGKDRGRRPHRSPPPVVADNDRYSPLNGPILGTRREAAPFDPRLGARTGRQRPQ